MRVLDDKNAESVRDGGLSGIMSLEDVRQEVPDVEEGDVVMDEIGYFWEVK